jgi:hypothetical protein
MIEGISVVSLTPSALLGIAVLMLLTGRLIPRATLQDKAKEAEEWKQAYELERTARTTADAQTRELLEVAKTSEAVLSAVYKQSELQRARNEDSDAL